LATTSKSGKGKVGASAMKSLAEDGRSLRNRQSAETKLAELKHRLHEMSDLNAATALLGWDHATYMPKCGAGARSRQGATLSKLVHEKSVDPDLGKLLDGLERHASSLPRDSDDASLIRVARRDFERAIKVPAEYVARASAFGSASYDAWTRARPANDFPTMRPFLETAVDLGREYAGFFAPYTHIADPLIDGADQGMTTALVRSLFAALREGLVPIVRAIADQSSTDDDCLRGTFDEAAQLDFGLFVARCIDMTSTEVGSTRPIIHSARPCRRMTCELRPATTNTTSGSHCSRSGRKQVMRSTNKGLTQDWKALRSDRARPPACTRANPGFGKT